MRLGPLPAFVTALTDPNESGARNQVALIAFGERPTVFTEYTSSPAELQKGINRIWAQRGSRPTARAPRRDAPPGPLLALVNGALSSRFAKIAQACAREVDVMVVVGGKTSANTKHLADLAATRGARSYHIEGPEELQPQWFAGVNVAGLMSGASTPGWLVDKVEAQMEALSRRAS